MNIQNNLLIYKWGDTFTLHTFTVGSESTNLDNYTNMDVFKYMKEHSVECCPPSLQRSNYEILKYGNFMLYFIDPDNSILFYETYKNK
jgi:hypothetical protein